MSSVDPGMWLFLSRMHQLALELNTDMKAGRMPILKSMYRAGLIDVELRGTRANKKMVLSLMCDTMREIDPDWSPSNSVVRALNSK